MNQEVEPTGKRIFVLPPRRFFSPYFSAGAESRENFVGHNPAPTNRSEVTNFAGRLFTIHKHRKDFDNLFRRIIDPVPDWYIERHDTGQYFLSVRSGSSSHDSDGMGEGLISLMFVVDSLYDSEPGSSIIVIDEPELSLHPPFQRRLRELLCEYAKDRQIVCATHSPYFIDWPAIADGASIVRVTKHDDRSVLHHLTDSTRSKLLGLLTDSNNPHVLGLEAGEVFFLDDGIILVEGQEDVLHYRKILEQLARELPGSFYGWGVGGANKMEIVASLLCDLGFKRVVGILDNNVSALKGELESRFKDYKFFLNPADDVRSKPAVDDLLDSDGSLQDRYKASVEAMFDAVGAALSGGASEGDQPTA